MRNSLSVKVFLWILAVLTLCSLVVYACVMLTLPERYMTIANDRVAEEADELMKALDGIPVDASDEMIYDFCIRNGVRATLTASGVTQEFGNADTGQAVDGEAFSLAMSIRFSDATEPGMLVVVAPTSARSEVTAAFIRLLPYIAVLIIVLSSASAWFCTRVIVRPIVQISSVSKRMAQMDMTWRCESRSHDELGVLADSLNTLSERLTKAMNELQTANEQLRKDIANAQALEKERGDFFAAASHELKTPLTILKGQIESMVLGIGDYKHTEKYLPEALRVTEEMERLIGEILAISKMNTSVSFQPMTEESLGDLIQACITQIQPLIVDKGLIIQTAGLEQRLALPVYKPLFAKAVSNVLSNAVRYSPNGSLIEVTLTAQALLIRNTGVTMTEDAIRNAFTPFFRAERSRNRASGGSGLGLYIVKQILDIHGLQYAITSDDNSVRFRIDLYQN